MSNMLKANRAKVKAPFGSSAMEGRVKLSGASSAPSENWEPMEAERALPLRRGEAVPEAVEAVEPVLTDHLSVSSASIETTRSL